MGYRPETVTARSSSPERVLRTFQPQDRSFSTTFTLE